MSYSHRGRAAEAQPVGWRRINQTCIRTSTGIWTASYNAQNRPTRFTRENADGTRTVITAAYDYMGRRAWKKVETIATDPETGEETATVTLHQRYIYRGYLQVAACDLTRGGHPCLWLITWDPTQSIATRPLGIQKDGTWYCYGWDLTKNICEVYGQAGYIRTTYSYSPYGSVTGEGDVAQPLQWSSEYADPELGLVYYNYRSYNPRDGRWNRRDPSEVDGLNLYVFNLNNSIYFYDELGNLTRKQRNTKRQIAQSKNRQGRESNRERTSQLQQSTPVSGCSRGQTMLPSVVSIFDSGLQTYTFHKRHSAFMKVLQVVDNLETLCRQAKEHYSPYKSSCEGCCTVFFHIAYYMSEGCPVYYDLIKHEILYNPKSCSQTSYMNPPNPFAISIFSVEIAMLGDAVILQ